MLVTGPRFILPLESYVLQRRLQSGESNGAIHQEAAHTSYRLNVNDEKWGHSDLNSFDINMMLKMYAIVKKAKPVAVLDLPSNQHNQSGLI